MMMMTMMMMMTIAYITVDTFGDWTHFARDGSYSRHGMKRKESESSFGGTGVKIMHEQYKLDWSQSEIFLVAIDKETDDRFYLKLYNPPIENSKMIL